MAKVLFIQEIYFPFQSTSKLSGYLKEKGHQVELFIGEGQKAVDHVKKINPDLISFSVLTPYRNHMLATSKHMKEAGIKTPMIAGGYDIMFLPELLEFSDIDIICRGEGELPLGELCERIDKKEDYSNIQNLWVKDGDKIYKNNLRQWSLNMDEWPFDDRDIYLDYDSYFHIVPFTQVLAGRGCPYPCAYCFNDGYRKIYQEGGSKGYCKLRSVDHLMEELLILKNKYKSRYIFFNDSTLTYNKKWILEFLKAYKEKIKIPFSLNAVITEIDEEVGRALGDAKYCELVRFGLETGNEEYRNKVLKKNVKDKSLFKGAGILAKNKIRYSMAMMFGLPGETQALAWETIDKAKRLSVKNSVHAVNIFKPFPGLGITDYGIEIGQYNQDDLKIPAILKQRSKNSGGGDDSIDKLAMGNRDLVFYENYRIDEEGRLLSNLSRYSHVAIRMPFLRPLIKQIIKFPDNFINRFIWKLTEGVLNIRVHANVPFSFFVKYFLFHSRKRIR
ncbi:MAG: B12-binding domain-containing radical SAM protein [bacterium]